MEISRTPIWEAIHRLIQEGLLVSIPNRGVFVMDLSAEAALELYRGRWQVELAFKRMKSLLGIGHLHKKVPEGIVAWLYGKLFCAVLIERLLEAAEFFSPREEMLRQMAA